MCLYLASSHTHSASLSLFHSFFYSLVIPHHGQISHTQFACAHSCEPAYIPTHRSIHAEFTNTLTKKEKHIKVFVSKVPLCGSVHTSASWITLIVAVLLCLERGGDVMGIGWRRWKSLTQAMRGRCRSCVFEVRLVCIKLWLRQESPNWFIMAKKVGERNVQLLSFNHAYPQDCVHFWLRVICEASATDHTCVSMMSHFLFIQLIYDLLGRCLTWKIPEKWGKIVIKSYFSDNKSSLIPSVILDFWVRYQYAI